MSCPGNTFKSQTRLLHWIRNTVGLIIGCKAHYNIGLGNITWIYLAFKHGSFTPYYVVFRYYLLCKGKGL
jgi:hypothetical protein